MFSGPSKRLGGVAHRPVPARHRWSTISSAYADVECVKIEGSAILKLSAVERMIVFQKKYPQRSRETFWETLIGTSFKL